jgi:hypothetical protein
MPRVPPGEQGFSLVESLVACTLLAVGLLTVVQLFGLAASLNVASRHATLAVVLAAQKVEELRAAAVHTGGADFLDAYGRPVPASGDAPPPTAVYARRWTVDPLDVDPIHTAIVEVSVAPAAGGTPARREVRLVAVRTRKSP